MSVRIGLATTVEMPLVDDDEKLLCDHLPEAEVVAWDDPDVVWSRYDAVFLRSTWNYHNHRDAFLRWVDQVHTVSTVWNPPGMVRWNTDKRYLAELAAKGYPVVATEFFAPGEKIPSSSLEDTVVVKPSVGAGSNGAKMFRSDPEAALAHAEALHESGKTVMVQPYVSAIDDHGERALMYVGGNFSHAATKAPILSQNMSWSTGIYADEKITRADATAEEKALADALVADMPATAYARIDLVPGPEGPLILELEVTEPSLFLWLDEEAPARTAAAFRQLVT